MRMLRPALAAFLMISTPSAWGYEPPEPDWTSAGITAEKQSPAYWLQRAPDADSVLLQTAAIQESNRRLLAFESGMADWQTWPNRIPREAIRSRIEALSKRPQTPLFKNANLAVTPQEVDGWMANLDLENIMDADDRLFGMAVKRTALRRFPTEQRAFDSKGGIDIDRLQESALFPGSPVAVLHESKDRQWLFVQSENYAAWVKADAIGLASRQFVMAHATRQPRRWITGSQIRTVFHPYAKEVSEQVLDMGSSLPVRTDWPLSKPVNGQGSLGAWIVDYPLRLDNGLLHVKPVLIPRSADTSDAPLAATHGNLIRQSFKFIGERYGWGHDYNGRDCSGFVSEVYRSLGVLIPRNTGDQQRAENFRRIAFTPEMSRTQRIELIRKLRIGDLVYIPGHVMMVIGQDSQGPWVIHDSHTSGIVVGGGFRALPTNGVAVTPLQAMAFGPEKSYLDAITAVQRIFPEAP
ncbi:MAG: SH3 domain-containing protein [Arenimonas sp.]|uniref:C40 family peptidase n=1 Tax=Arenimonas sp. TaxID=1872635 RepID=UPI003C1063BA